MIVEIEVYNMIVEIEVYNMIVEIEVLYKYYIAQLVEILVVKNKIPFYITIKN
jgi:hypothetical protein